MTHARKPRRNKAYKGPTLPRLPVMGPLRDEFGMSLHTALSCLEHAPTEAVWMTLARTFNLVQLALEHDQRHTHEARLINGGAAALNQVEKRACRGVILHDYELAPIRVGVNTIDGLLGKLDVIKLNYARMRLNAMQTQGA
ncbi:hypothetical protein [Achromobacter aegrifaciens]|uniref:hypothetical protein n=1 Tax=Achromobacter aegrifaciens TaxID=1287736 RepID=UPI000F73B80B|nr:hypothetical protein [Achromobacter aegrifaciens]RSE88180.1 hypothetical protein EGU54_33565 [Achromobacter aegrifaciens]